MTPGLRHGLLGVAIGIAASLAVFLLARPVGHEQIQPSLQQPPSASPQSAPEGHDHVGHAVPHEEPAQQTESPAGKASSLQGNIMVVSPERLQSIGVKFELAERRPLQRTIRTVGRVEIDERRLAHVHLKLEGWIDELRVNYTGEQVKQGQILFTLYSPELVTTQQEYLLALKGKKALGGSPFPEVVEGAQSLLAVTAQRLRLWDITEDHIQDLERTGKVRKTLPIHSPITGTVINKVALAGMRVSPGDELYTIADLSHIWITADIYEYELPLIKVGQMATVTLSYAPGTVLQGRVGFIYPMLDPQTRTAKVRFELDNPGEQLKPGMYANVELQIPLGTRLAIPRDAVLESGERQVIFIHHGGGTLEWRTVKLGVRAGDWVEVLEGIAEGDHLVTSANFLIDSESRLKTAVGGMQGMKH